MRNPLYRRVENSVLRRIKLSECGQSLADTGHDYADKDWLRPTPSFIARVAALLWDMIVVLFICLAIAAVISTNEARAATPAFRLQTDPVKPPRCPKRNVDGALLKASFASQADGREWTHECRY